MLTNLLIKLTEGKRTDIMLGGYKVKLYIVSSSNKEKYEGNIKTILNTVSSNIKKYIKFISTSLYPDYKKYYLKGEPLSKEVLEKTLKPEYISIHRDGGVTLSFYDDGKFFRGHIIDLVLTPKLAPEGAPSLQG